MTPAILRTVPSRLVGGRTVVGQRLWGDAFAC